MTCPPRSLATLPLLLSTVLLASFPTVEAAPRKKTTKDPATVYVIRGGGGYFPNLGTVINEKFEEKGLEVVDFRYHERTTAAKKVAEAYRAGDLPHGIILIGYSLGGCGALEMSKALQSENLPVRLLFLIETINPMQTVPANVQECFNLYHFPALLGSAVKADSPNTKLTNFEAYTDGGLGLKYSHFAMPFVEEVHDLISERLLAAINTKAPKPSAKPPVASTTARSKPTVASTTARSKPTVVSTSRRKPGSGEEVPASEMKDGKKPGPFAKLFAKPAAEGAAEIEAPGKPASKSKGSR